MEASELKKLLNELVAKRQLKTVLDLFKLVSLPSDDRHNITLWKSNLLSIEQERIRDVSPVSELLQRENRLCEHVLTWLDNLDEALLCTPALVEQLQIAIDNLPQVMRKELKHLEKGSINIQHTGNGDVFVGNKIVNK